MDRLRDALLLIEETASVETPAPLLFQDVALLGRQLCGMVLADSPASVVKRAICLSFFIASNAAQPLASMFFAISPADAEEVIVNC